jgi:hypothetical protein
MANNTVIMLKQLFDMPLLSIWKPNDMDLIVRCPGGWIFTVNKFPVFVPEPGSDSAHNYVATLDELLKIALQKDESEPESEDDAFDEIEDKLEVLENERTALAKKKESISCESVHCDGCSGECGQVGETAEEIRVRNESTGELNS